MRNLRCNQQMTADCPSGRRTPAPHRSAGRRLATPVRGVGRSMPVAEEAFLDGLLGCTILSGRAGLPSVNPKAGRET